MTQISYKADVDVMELVTRVLKLYKEKSHNRLVISVAGVPGSGKTTFTAEVVRILNQTIPTLVLPQDGFHYYRGDLAKFEDPKKALERRGAPFTFNAKAFVGVISKLNDPLWATVDIHAPSFDHRLKDPVENDIKISPEVKIVFLEGNYVSLKDPIWTDISSFCDETWFVATEWDIVLGRIIRRHLEAGIAATEEEAKFRAQGSDQMNAEYIIANSKPTTVLITNNK
ncbi:hypothetical protein CAAN1_16S00386 [[Candida] anglica]|uniref:Phosphoribulokinase/uridine kinase domain-containing protein n=1 Tax=[Candida] anglica TaxID=148631 RepID=A0ABP0ED79_9ASCO